MKKFLLASVLALLLTSCASAQGPNFTNFNFPPPRPDTVTMDELIAARAKLIQRYAGKAARGVSICGYTDAITGIEHSYLTIYVYRDSVNAFAADFNKFGTPTPGGSTGVDGVTVTFQVIQRQKKEASK